MSELLLSGVTTLADLSMAHPGWLDLLAESGMRVCVAPMFRSARWFTKNGHLVEYDWDAAAGEKAMAEALSLVERAQKTDPGAAREIIESASLVRGYGDTWKRGHANWARIADEIVEPMLSAPKAHFADAVLQARIAANADPEGKRLANVIDSLTKLKAA